MGKRLYGEDVVAQVKVLIEDQKMQQHHAAKILGMDRTTLQRICKRMGFQTQRTGPRDGAGHPSWRGGVRVVKGYRMIWSKGHPYATKSHYVAEHRLVMESVLGRYLLRSEVVHHVDGNRQNNAPSNLMVFQSNPEHLRHELTGRIPQWSPEGIERLRVGIRKAAAIHRHIKTDDDLRILSIPHLPKSDDSKDESQFS